MSVFGLVLVLLAACCHAIWNFCVKKINSGPELIWLFSLCSIVMYCPVALWIGQAQPISLDRHLLVFIVGSIMLHLGYFLLLQYGYRKGDLSVVYPIARATGPLLSSAFAVLLLQQFCSIPTVIGGLIVIVAVSQLCGPGADRSHRPMISLAFGAIAGIFIGSYTVWDAYTVSVLWFPPLLLDYVSSIGRCLLLAPVAVQRHRELKRVWQQHKWRVVVIAVFNPLAYILVLYALTFTPVIYVAPTREVSVLLTVLLGSLVLKEGQLGRRIRWGAVMVFGMGLLSLGG